jgi:hypothetical protein
LWKLITRGYAKGMGVPYKEVVASVSLNALEKYAAKKSLAKRVIERLSTSVYGKKPGSGGTITGATIGGLAGGIPAAYAAAPYGSVKGMSAATKWLKASHKKARGPRGEAATASAIAHGLLGLVGIPAAGIAGGVAGGVGGGLAGGLGGGVLGGLVGKGVDKIRMAKYLARRKKINKRLLLGGGVGAGTGALAVLAAKKRKKK